MFLRRIYAPPPDDTWDHIVHVSRLHVLEHLLGFAAHPAVPRAATIVQRAFRRRTRLSHERTKLTDAFHAWHDRTLADHMAWIYRRRASETVATCLLRARFLRIRHATRVIQRAARACLAETLALKRALRQARARNRAQAQALASMRAKLRQTRQLCTPPRYPSLDTYVGVSSTRTAGFSSARPLDFMGPRATYRPGVSWGPLMDRG